MPEIIPNWHPLAVHFPIALITLSLFFHLLGLVTRGTRCGNHCAILAHTTLWLGALAAILTAILGWLASNSVNHDEAGHIAMLTHRTWAVITLGVVAVVAGWDAWRYTVEAELKPGNMLLVAVAWGLISITAWHGGELVYRHGLGVLALPAEEGEHDHHSHEHSEAFPTQPSVTDKIAPQEPAIPHDHDHDHPHAH